MAGVSEYERSQIGAVLSPRPERQVERGVGMFVTPVVNAAGGGAGSLVADVAVLPAMRANRLNVRDVGVAFDDTAGLSDVCRWVQGAEVIVVDLSDLNPAVMYVLGLAHALGRYPILIVRRAAAVVPFNLAALRCESYVVDKAGLVALRETLKRRIRGFLDSAQGC